MVVGVLVSAVEPDASVGDLLLAQQERDVAPSTTDSTSVDSGRSIGGQPTPLRVSSRVVRLAGVI